MPVQVEDLDAGVTHRGDRPQRRLEVLRARAADGVQHQPDAGHQNGPRAGWVDGGSSWRGPLGLGGDGNRTLAAHRRPPYPMAGALLDERGGGAVVAEAIDVPAARSRRSVCRPAAGIGDGGQQQPRVGVQRAVEDVVRRALLDDAFRPPSRAPRRRRTARSRVVGDVEERDLAGPLETRRSG